MIRLPWRRAASPPPSGPAAAGAADAMAAGSHAGSRPDSPDPAGTVRGERGASLVTGARSLQARMSSLLAAGLMTVVGATMLFWYYAEALSHPAAGRAHAHGAIAGAAGGGLTLPPFGPLSPPGGAPPAGPESAATATTAAAVLPAAAVPESVPEPALAAGPLLEPALARAPGAQPTGYGQPPQLSPRQRQLDRRLSGNVFTTASTGASPDLDARESGSGLSPDLAGARAPQSVTSAGGDPLRRLLRPTVLTATRAQVLPSQHLLLPQGAFIDCTLETAIDSSLPGMTTCVTATDTFSADGTVVLLERGTKLIGETRGEVRQGQARVFVVWTQARTPAGVIVRLDSPGADALGRSGLEGRVDRHFWQRFGAAALVSTIDGAVQSEVQSSSRGGTVVLDPSASEDVLTEILRSTVAIPPTVRVRNGARIQVLVARDVDFRSVYELTPR
jgi:type IV secretion system protein VirB10